MTETNADETERILSFLHSAEALQC